MDLGKYWYPHKGNLKNTWETPKKSIMYKTGINAFVGLTLLKYRIWFAIKKAETRIKTIINTENKAFSL